ncbi:MAG: hypothetical protein CSB44_04305 [Gammaproteobacteria bacterium]|nr:MAG: hypothetical protein CSB44_04305 [Gammaproteobacteria bacterium]
MSSVVQAQDLFTLTSDVVSSRGYDYVDAQYIFTRDGNPPVVAYGRMSLTDNVAIAGRLFNADFESDIDNQPVDVNETVYAATRELSAGILYHDDFPFLKDTDWLAGLSFGRRDYDYYVEPSGDGSRIDLGDDSRNFRAVYGGFRRSLGLRLEVELTAIYYDDDDLATDYFYGRFNVIHHLTQHIDLAAALNDFGGDNSDLVSAGVRLGW